MSQILEGVDGVECNIDDVLVHGATQQEHEQRLEAVVQRLPDANVALNAKKCVFKVLSVNYRGQIVGSDAWPEENTPNKSTRSPFLSWNGNQISKFTSNLAGITKPIREILVKNIAWTCGPPQQDAFYKIKTALTTSPILTLYDPSKATKIAADASSYGLGAVVLQEEPDTWKPVSFIPRSMTATEAKYAQIEALAVTWACERSSNYIIGKQISTETDLTTLTLVGMLISYTVDKLPPRLQRPKLRLMRFNIKDDTWQAALHGRYSIKTNIKRINPTNHRRKWNSCVYLECNRCSASISSKIIRNPTCSRQRQNMQRSKEIMQWGKVSVNAANEPKYPPGGQESASGLKPWTKFRQQHQEPLMPTPIPERPWQLIATDLSIQEKVTYLIVVDYYSRYVEVVTLFKSTSSLKVIQALKKIFARHGSQDGLIQAKIRPVCQRLDF